MSACPTPVTEVPTTPSALVGGVSLSPSAPREPSGVLGEGYLEKNPNLPLSTSMDNEEESRAVQEEANASIISDTLVPRELDDSTTQVADDAAAVRECLEALVCGVEQEEETPARLKEEQAAARLKEEQAAVRIKEEQAAARLKAEQALAIESAVAAALAEAAAAAAAVAAAKAIRLEETFTCGVCLGVLFEPVTNTCSHSLCYECLQQLPQLPDSPRTCPTCRAPFAMPTGATAWTVNTAIMDLLSANDGPSYRAIAPTLKLHAALRTDTPAPVLEALRSSDMTLQLYRRSRLPAPPLSVALGAVKKYCLVKALKSQWESVCTEMVKVAQPGDLDDPLSALDNSFSIGFSELLLDRGASKCTEIAFERVSGWHLLFGKRLPSGVVDKSGDQDSILLRLLNLLPTPLKPASPELHKGLIHVIKIGHKETTLRLLRAKISPPTKKELDGFPMLHFLCGNSDLSSLEYTLRKAADAKAALEEIKSSTKMLCTLA